MYTDKIPLSEGQRQGREARKNESGLARALPGALSAGNVETDKPDVPRLRRAQGAPRRVQDGSSRRAVPRSALGGFREFVRGSGGRAPSGGLGATPPTSLDSTYRTTATTRATAGKRIHTGCGKYTWVRPDDHGQAWRYSRFRCGCWSCRSCFPRKVKQVRQRIIELATENRLTRLMTLTLDPAKIGDPGVILEHLRHLSKCWRKMRVYLCRYNGGKSITYVAVLELHPKSGRPHLHVLVNLYILQAWISKAWNALGGGRVVDIRLVDVHRVAAYVSKYVTKDSLADIPEGVRRFYASKGLVLWPKKDNTGKPKAWLTRRPFEVLRLVLSPLVVEEKFERQSDGHEVLASFLAGELPATATVPLRKGGEL